VRDKVCSPLWAADESNKKVERIVHSAAKDSRNLK